MIANSVSIWPAVLEVSIPTLILSLVITVLAVRYLRDDTDSHSPASLCQPKKNILNSPQPRTIEKFQQVDMVRWYWINRAWENTWSLRVKQFYWEADRKVREFLASKGWNV